MDEAVAYPIAVLQDVNVVNDLVTEKPIAVLWEAGTTSASDSGGMATGRDVGAANSFSRVLKGETLFFQFVGDRIVDEATGSVWNVLGQAVEGELAGS